MQKQYISFLCAGFFVLTLFGQAVKVENKSGNKHVWGAIYYVQKRNAERIGSVQRIADQATFKLPEQKDQAGRYLAISQNQKQLHQMVAQPFGIVGISLIPIAGLDHIQINESHLPEEAH